MLFYFILKGSGPSLLKDSKPQLDMTIVDVSELGPGRRNSRELQQDPEPAEHPAQVDTAAHDSYFAQLKMLKEMNHRATKKQVRIRTTIDRQRERVQKS